MLSNLGAKENKILNDLNAFREADINYLKNLINDNSGFIAYRHSSGEFTAEKNLMRAKRTIESSSPWTEKHIPVIKERLLWQEKNRKKQIEGE